MLLIVCLVIMYSFFSIFLARMGGRLPATLGVALFSIISGIIPLCYYLYERLVRHVADVPVTAAGLFYAITAGVIIAVWNVLVVILFAKGGNLSYIFPIIYGAGAIAIPSLVGWLLFKEQISPLQGGGILLILIGFGCIIFSKL